jgi:tryptophan synthase alpha chain
MRHPLMSHLVAYYPDRDSSLDVARALIDGGSTYLEVQFPFSDPTADGRLIQTACSRALEQGFKTDGGFELIARIRDHSDIPIFLMCYANTIFYHGIEVFLDRCLNHSVRGIIVPDLPLDYDENLFSLAAERGICAVPVVAPTVREERIRLIAAMRPVYLYAALRKGITGGDTVIGEHNIRFLRRIRSFPGGEDVRILAGFGISKADQISALSSHVHAVIVGSAFIGAITLGGFATPYDAVMHKMEELLG